MNEDNLRLVMDGFAAYARGDEAALRGIFDPEIEVYADTEMLNAGTFRGWEGWRRWTSEWEEAWEEITYEPLETIDVDDSLMVVRVRVKGTGRGSGVEVTNENAYLFETRGGKCTRFHLYATREKALAAARRLSEES